MHAAPPPVVPSVASGAGHGMFFVLAALAPAGALPESVWFTLVAYCLAFLLATTGVLAPAGLPDRAGEEMRPRRENGANWPFRGRMAALFAFAAAGVLAIERLVRIEAGVIDRVTHALAATSAVAAAAAVFCAAMALGSAAGTHGSTRWTVANLLSLGLMTGSLCVYVIVLLFGADGAIVGLLALASIAAGGLVKRGYWRSIDRAVSGPESGAHTGRQRAIAAWGTYSLPALLIIAAALTGTGWPAKALALIAAALAGAGVLVERRLLFGETRQVPSADPDGPVA